MRSSGARRPLLTRSGESAPCWADVAAILSSHPAAAHREPASRREPAM